MNMFWEILYNLGMLVSLSILSGFISISPSQKVRREVFQGLLFGLGSVIGMLHPLVLSPGLIFDGRSVMISVCTLFFGPLAGSIAALMALVLRIYQGGGGLVMGVLVIVASAFIGYLFSFGLTEKEEPISALRLIIMGIMVHVAMVLFMFTLPNNQGPAVVKSMGPIVLIAYPAATVLCGMVLSEVRRRNRMQMALQSSQIEIQNAYKKLEASYEELRAKEADNREQVEKLTLSEARFRMIIEQAPVGINISDFRDGKMYTVNQKYADIVGRTVEELLGTKWMLLTHPDDERACLEIAERMRKKEILFADFDKRYIKPNGDIVYVNVRALHFDGDDEHPQSEISFVYDMTEMKQTLNALAASERNFRNIFENASDAMLLFSDGIITDCNWSAANLLGNGNLESLIGKNVLAFSPEYQGDGVLSEIKANNAFETCERDSYFRLQWIHENPAGNLIPVDVMLTDLNFQGKRMTHAIIRDMTVQRAMEKQLEHMSYHDQLTDLYNRRFFEEELQRMDVPRNLPLTLIMADVNNLKLINDSFGHATGDKLLILAAKLIRICARRDEVVARIGGDEFMIILPHTSEEEAARIPARVQQLATDHNLEGLEISISFGLATKTNEDESISDVLKKAEDSLYKQKLFESPSVRGRTIQTIIHTLHEKNKREEQHSRRVSAVCQVIGQAMNLPDSEIRELQNMGLLHDIGKIAIDEQILNNPGRLSEDEWSQMRKHPEIGYRILSTVNDMSEMAEYVLAHHERWDGKGYPKGLRGNEIPIKARIIALADAYDAMTSDRTYRKAMEVEAALSEIRKCAGTQFDPELAELFVSAVIDGGLNI